MTPAGHFAISYIIGQSTKKKLIIAVILGGVIPDIDIVLMPFDIFNEYHRVITHNFLFIALFAALFSVFSRQNRLNVFISVIVGGLLHLFIDSINDNNPSNGIGVAWLWPFFDATYSPFNLTNPDKYITGGWHSTSVMIKASFKMLLWELPFVLVMIFLFLKKRKKSF